MVKKILISTVIFYMYLFSTCSFSFSSELDDVQAAIEAKGANWVAGETSISRLSAEEREKRLGVVEESSFAGEEQTVPKALTLPVPANLDWRNHNGGNFVTSIKDQWGCGSCWAFGTTAALESYILINENLPNTDLDLAEQVLISCGEAGDCDGGSPDLASYFLRDIGLPLEVCYPYTTTNGNCSDACENWESEKTYTVGEVVSDYGVSAEFIKHALTMYGPIVVSFNVYSDFFYYTNGIYSYTSGNFEGGHCCLIVGYNDDDQCFIVKNSWGTGWGEAGFFRIAYSEVNSPVAFNNIIYYTKYTVPYVSQKMTVDGELSESAWDIATDISKVIYGTTDNTAKFGVLWDSTYLYVGVKVLDINLYHDSRSSGLQLFDDDSVEIAIDGDHNRGTTYDSYDRYFLKGWNNAGLDGFNQNGVLHGWATISGGYSIEIAIPWSNLGIIPTPGMTIGFSVGYNDDDNGEVREALVVWTGTANNWQDTSALRDIVLGPEIINDIVTFDPNRPFLTTSDTTGCGDGFLGQFIFDARLRNKSNSAFLLSDLVVKVRELTNGNLLENADGGAGGVGANLTVPEEGDYADGVLSPGESVDVHFFICLTNFEPFRFFVDVLGIKEAVSSQALEAPQSTDTEQRRIKSRKGSRVTRKGFFGRFRP